MYYLKPKDTRVQDFQVETEPKVRIQHLQSSLKNDKERKVKVNLITSFTFDNIVCFIHHTESGEESMESFQPIPRDSRFK